MQITLTFHIDTLNQLLTALGQLPFVQAAPLINAIHEQAMPQVQAQQGSQNGNEVDQPSNQEAGVPA